MKHKAIFYPVQERLKTSCNRASYRTLFSMSLYDSFSMSPHRCGLSKNIKKCRKACFWPNKSATFLVLEKKKKKQSSTINIQNI